MAEGFGIVVIEGELAQVGGSQPGLDQRLAADVCGGHAVVGHWASPRLRAATGVNPVTSVLSLRAGWPAFRVSWLTRLIGFAV